MVKLELLSPAANPEIGKAAITHGADAVYIGGPSHGARKSAANTLDGIAELVDFAHDFRAKVYVTVNTIIYDSEIRRVEELCRDLYRIGTDALIVQDMGLLRMKLPPIALHASTQCDIRTPGKARFLEEVGFSQLVIPRELTLEEIKDITDAVSVPVECFIHGALCVSYSGRCHASFVANGRSANRGECAQICRLPYNLTDAEGKSIVKNKHLLSLKDLNASSKLTELVSAGVSSFKIEGRLKEMDYVKNVTSNYDILLNRIISGEEGRYARASYGKIERRFEPNVCKSFNRGFTTYFLDGTKPKEIASLATPKSMGELIEDNSKLNNGDGISFFNSKGEYVGVNVNGIVNGSIIPGKKTVIPQNAEIHRTLDIQWQKMMNRETAVRTMWVDVRIDSKGIEAIDERGCFVRLPIEFEVEKSQKEMDYREELSRLGNSVYRLRGYESSLESHSFIPRSQISALRRRLVLLLDEANKSTYPLDLRRMENLKIAFPVSELNYRDNVSNALARKFYESHGAANIESALESTPGRKDGEIVVMTTKHCILRELGLCRKTSRNNNFSEPLFLSSGKLRYRLHFDCRRCRMQILGK